MKKTTPKQEQFEVFVSTNYKDFHFLQENRGIIPKKIAELRQSIEQYGNLRLVIVVELEGKLYIADGQHLFTALMLMGRPIFYKVIEIKDKRELIGLITKLNSTSTPWKLIDYVTCWANFGLKDYKFLKSYIDLYDYGTSEMAAIISGHNSAGQAVSKIKSGNFKALLPKEEIDQLISYTEDVIKFLPDISRFQRAHLVISFVKYYRLKKNYDHTKTLRLIRENLNTFKVFTEVKEFYEFFKEVDKTK